MGKRKNNTGKLGGVAAAECSVVGSERIHSELKEFLGYALKHLAFRIRARMDESLSPYGLMAPQCGILQLIQNLGSMTQKELGANMAVDKATMVRMLDVLEEKGLAVRKNHETDRRAKVLTITPKGRKFLEKAKIFRQEAEEAVLAPLTAAEQVELKRLIGKVAHY